MAYKVVYEGPGAAYGFPDGKVIPVGAETEVSNEEGKILVSLSEQGVIRMRITEAPKSAPAEVQAQARQQAKQQSEGQS